MTKKYKVQIKSLNKDIEEEVVLELNGVELTCHASYCPYKLGVNEFYEVEFEGVVFDDYLVEESRTQKTELRQHGDSYQYSAYGKLVRNVLHSVIEIEDDELLSDYGYLDGKYVRMNIDRLDVSFCD